MLDDLRLNLPECDAINLQTLGIDWQNFNLACVKYYNKWSHMSTNVNIKTFVPTQLPAEQVKNFYTGYTFYEDSSDIFSRVNEIFAQTPLTDEMMPPEQSYNWYNSDIIDEFAIIKTVISRIETYINMEFGHVKLRYVGPRDVETIHTDYGSYRYHLPIVTNNSVFFVSGNKLFHMLNSDKLYILDTNTPHTIVNAAGVQGRLHLIATNKATEYEFTNADLRKTAVNYANHAQQALEKLSPADLELNSEVYKKTKIQLLKLKKLNNQ
jgi:hypothetical protein